MDVFYCDHTLLLYVCVCHLDLSDFKNIVVTHSEKYIQGRYMAHIVVTELLDISNY